MEGNFYIHRDLSPSYFVSNKDISLNYRKNLSRQIPSSDKNIPETIFAFHNWKNEAIDIFSRKYKYFPFFFPFPPFKISPSKFFPFYSSFYKEIFNLTRSSTKYSSIIQGKIEKIWRILDGMNIFLEVSFFPLPLPPSLITGAAKYFSWPTEKLVHIDAVYLSAGVNIHLACIFYSWQSRNMYI